MSHPTLSPSVDSSGDSSRALLARGRAGEAEALDILFARNTKAQDFKTQMVDILNDGSVDSSEKVH